MATVKIPLKPITVPNFILLDSPTFSSIAIGHLDNETLEALIKEFVSNVWKKVDKDREARK